MFVQNMQCSIDLGNASSTASLHKSESGSDSDKSDLNLSEAKLVLAKETYSEDNEGKDLSSGNLYYRKCVYGGGILNDIESLKHLIERISHVLIQKGTTNCSWNWKWNRGVGWKDVTFDPDGCIWTLMLSYNFKSPHSSSDASDDQTLYFPVQINFLSLGSVDQKDNQYEIWLKKRKERNLALGVEAKIHPSIIREGPADSPTSAGGTTSTTNEKQNKIEVALKEFSFLLERVIVKFHLPEFKQGCKGNTFKATYQLNKKLTQGSFATVCKGTHRESNTTVAIKIIMRSRLSTDEELCILKEVSILSSLNHKFINRIIDFFEEDEYFYLVLEYMDGGDLFQRIGTKKKYTEKDARDLCYQLIQAINFCHQNNITHRDLKSKNVLMVSETHDASIKLADFGFATWIYTPTSLTKSCGTPFFVAPEIIISNLKYDQIADMWSVGVILFMLLSGELPFKGTNLQGLYKAIIQQELVFDPSFWNGVSQDAQELVRGLLQKNPAKRMTAQQALNSSWFQGDSTRLALINLQETSKRLKVFNARRMWKVVGHAVMATNYFNNMIKLNQKNSATFEEEQHEFEKKIDKLIEEG